MHEREEQLVARQRDVASAAMRPVPSTSEAASRLWTRVRIRHAGGRDERAVGERHPRQWDCVPIVPISTR
ncbi:hypothetical protein [Nonomuraea africana]|uniref:hypothetical protein n=1 Tax=Nonomuraea africana TaxID=46171 RepID=UPI0034060D36